MGNLKLTEKTSNDCHALVTTRRSPAESPKTRSTATKETLEMLTVISARTVLVTNQKNIHANLGKNF
jgi:hypothetical protein